ncbi:MAG TPA: PAS domain S-box protein, partial [Longimicrobiaceae bacterium]|nr:PAS domain S-box protein [Longimicrobiaceae bacterium]
HASPEALRFFALTLVVAVWQGCFAAMYAATDAVHALAWARAAYLGIPLIPAAIYDFTAHVLRLRRRRTVWAAWLVGASFSILSQVDDHLIAGLYHYAWGWYPRFGPWGAPYLVFFGGVLLLAIREYWVRFSREPSARYRARIRWLMIAFGIAYVAVFDYLAVYGIGLYPFGYVPVLVFITMVAWTLGRYRLIDLTPSFASEQILATMADPLIVADAGGHIQIANAAVTTVLGYRAGSLIGRPLSSLAVEEAGIERLLSLQTVRDWETLLRGHDGEEVAASVSVSPLAGEGGERVGTVLIARDIRERKRAEDALRRSEARHRSLIENISDAIVVLDAEGRVHFASSSLEKVTGFRPDERVGSSAFERIHPEDRAGVGEEFAKMLATPGATLERSFRVEHREGIWRHVEATATNLLHDPAVAGIIVTYHDATERLAAEAALRESQEQLVQAQKMEAVGRLAGGIAHDFNNLLTVINGHVELARDGALSEGDAELLGEALRAGKRAAELTRQLLAFSRKQVLQPEVLDLNASVRHTERMLRRLIGEDVELVVSTPPELGRIKADPGQIDQVVLNLAVNARDAMPAGGRLTLRTADVQLGEGDLPGHWNVRPGAYVRLSVEDTGHGMSAEVQERIFDPFFTTKEDGKGTGLGLATVYGIVKQSDGYIHVESHEGEGTAFHVFLPCVAEEVEPAPAPDATRPLDGNETVLLVEDDHAVRTLTRQILRRYGYSILEAGSGAEALGVAHAHLGPIHLLVTDVVMPGMNGRVLAERLVASRPDTRVLFMSGYTDDAFDERRPLGDGIDFLQKPFSPRVLAERVRQRLDAADSTRAAG